MPHVSIFKSIEGFLVMQRDTRTENVRFDRSNVAFYFPVAGFFTSFFLGGAFGASAAGFSTFCATLEVGAD